MATDERWYFKKEQLINTPSRRCGIDADKELSFRQHAANFIQDMGQRLVVTQLCINTAIVYMHRFYLFHSLTHFPKNSIAAAALFLAAKVEEQPRKLEHVIKMSHMCLHRGEQPPPDVRSEQYLEQAQDLVFNENVLLQTLGFDVAIDHPHTHVVRLCQLVKASKDLAQTSYFMASNSLHLTTMCLQYKPTVVACFCIHLACKWSNWEIPQSNEGRHWFWYVDKSVTSELLQQLTAEFLHIFDKCPSRLKRKIMSISANQSPSINHPSLPNSPFDVEPRKVPSSSTTDSGPTFHSNRSHHTQEKQEEKKVPTTVSSRPSMDYREYREKKERIEREKATTSTTTAQSHMDLKKHHSHHHKPVSVTAPNKHQLPSLQKGTNLHHNNHRPDMKVGQTVQQRHSSSSQPREPNRDPNRQRLQREYNTGIGSTSTNITHFQGHITHQTKGSNLDNSLSDSGSHRTDVVSMPDSVSHSHLQEKLSNNNHSVHRLNTLDNKHQSHDKRIYDPKHKSTEYRKDSEQKAYGKYPDTGKVDRQQKPDVLEQKSEEVRKLIEKSLPLPKLTDLPYTMSWQKQAHHAKYQADKLQGSTTSSSSDMKHPSIVQNTYSQSKSPTTFVCSPQILQKSTLKNIQNLHAQGVSQILKDTIKNGGPQSCSTTSNNMDDSKSEKRSRYDDSGKNSINIQQSLLNTPPNKHRSLFSPEKTQTPKDSHAQRSKSKQKTSLAVKVKQERGLETPLGFHMLSPNFGSPHLQQQDSFSIKRSSCDTIPHKKRLGNTSDTEQATKIKLEDTSNLETMKMLGRIPDLMQSTDDKQSSNECRNSTSFINDSKSILFEPDSVMRRFSTATQHKVSSINLQTLTNGLDSNITIKQEPLEDSNITIKQEPLGHSNITIKQEALEHSNVTIKQEPLEHHIEKESYRTSDIVPIKSEYSHPQVKVEYTSPIKSALSISALLQEPLAPMPSLLQGMQQFNQIPSQLMQEQQSAHHTILLTDSQSTISTQCLSVSTASDSLGSIASTVDISALSCVPMTQQSGMKETLIAASISPLTVDVPTKEKRSEHHKSEKKKKEKKHKHKDKEKSKEKHKHKHKDKDKEKHREKEKERNEETPTAVPIRITIPKDKLNLGTDTAAAAISGNAIVPDKNKSPHSTGLKIKIPKERLKGTENVTSSPVQSVVQGPLKIKIRTDGISRNSATASLNGSSSANLNDPSEISHNNRKRFDLIDSSATSGPPPKKQSLTPATSYSQHRSGERQNGRHYSSGSNNKVRGGGRGARQHIGRGPPPLAGYYVTTGQRDDYYQRDNYNNSNNHARNQSQTHPPPVHGDSAYLRNSHVGQTQADPYFFANYPPPSIYNPAGYMYNPATYYQQYQEERQHQQQYSMYSAGNLIITPDGTIDTSVPPPLLLPNIHQGQNVFHQQMAASTQQKLSPSLPPPPPPPPPPLPSGPPPDSSPPPPPPPPE